MKLYYEGTSVILILSYPLLVFSTLEGRKAFEQAPHYFSCFLPLSLVIQTREVLSQYIFYPLYFLSHHFHCNQAQGQREMNTLQKRAYDHFSTISSQFFFFSWSGWGGGGTRGLQPLKIEHDFLHFSDVILKGLQICHLTQNLNLRFRFFLANSRLFFFRKALLSTLCEPFSLF